MKRDIPITAELLSIREASHEFSNLGIDPRMVLGYNIFRFKSGWFKATILPPSYAFH